MNFPLGCGCNVVESEVVNLDWTIYSPKDGSTPLLRNCVQDLYATSVQLAEFVSLELKLNHLVGNIEKSNQIWNKTLKTTVPVSAKKLSGRALILSAKWDFFSPNVSAARDRTAAMLIEFASIQA